MVPTQQKVGKDKFAFTLVELVIAVWYHGPFAKCSVVHYGVFILQERVLKCLELIRDLSLIKVSANSAGNFAPFVPQSPLGVLDATCLSYKSDESTVGSFTNSSQYSPNAKRKKLDVPSDGTCKSWNVNFPPSPKFI